MDVIKLLCSAGTVVAAFLAIFCTIPEVINNTNTQKQTQVVIEPRDGDIIVKDGDDYKLLQLINETDVLFPTKVQEIQYKKSESNQSKRVDILNANNEDWSNRDSFRYVMNSFSINPNKVINLLDNIESINVYCDFYTEKNISTYIKLQDDDLFKIDMKKDDTPDNFEVTKTNITSTKEYVTNELNDGIEWVKIRVEIGYIIGEKKITDTIVSDWIETDADLV